MTKDNPERRDPRELEFRAKLERAAAEATAPIRFDWKQFWSEVWKELKRGFRAKD